MTSHAENCSLQVFFMASQIDECDHFWRPWKREAFFNQNVKLVKSDSFNLTYFSQTRTQSKLPCSGRFTTLPVLSKPRISLPTEEVRPVSASCLCLNSLWRARPRPLSSSPWVKTPSKVDFPASTFPTTAQRISLKSWNVCEHGYVSTGYKNQTIIFVPKMWA